MRPLIGLGLAIQLASCATATSAEAARKPHAQREPAELEIDLREAPRHLLHAHLKLAAEPGPMTLVYPKWIPGEHGPTGPVADVASLQIRAGDKLIGWNRDDIEMYRLHIEVPRGETSLDISFDFISPPPTENGFSSGPSMTPSLALLSWNQVMLVPEGISPREFSFHPSVRLPAGWKDASALDEESRKGDQVSFKPVNMEKLIDSPVLAGSHLELIPLGENRGAPVAIAIAAETDAELRMSPAQLAGLQRLIAEEAALFGARHFDHYTFLLTLSDRVAHFGLEHHQSSDDRLAGRLLIDPELALDGLGGLLAHESVHSWNGKYRRPIGLATPDYQAPMKGDLLWIYEGLTEYLGTILTARAGFYDGPLAREDFAMAAQAMREARGRTTRPLADTAVAAQILYPAREDWSGLRRGVDFYTEGQLIWLEADVRIREKTRGARSLDDFCRLFFGGESGSPQVVPYSLSDVLLALNKVSPDDWEAFFNQRVNEVSDDAPLGGIVNGGWRLTSAAEPGALWKATEKSRKFIDLRPSLGIVIDSESNTIGDVVVGSPADKAGLSPGMKLIAIGGHRYSQEALQTAVEVSKSVTTPITLLIENADNFASTNLDYHGGPSYPTLERNGDTPDLLSAIFAPIARPAH